MIYSFIFKFPFGFGLVHSLFSIQSCEKVSETEKQHWPWCWCTVTSHK